MNWRLRLATGLGVVTIGLVLWGCGGGGISITEPSDPQVRFLNATPDGANLQFLLDSTVKASNLGYLQSSADFEEIEFVSAEDGGYVLIARNQATQFEYESEIISPARDSNTFIVALGLQNFGEEPEKRIRLAQIEVNRDRPQGNLARLIIVHALNRSEGNQTPPIRFKNPGDNPVYNFTNIAYAGSTTQTVDADEYVFQVLRDDVDGEAIYAVRTLSFEPGKIYLVVVSGIEGSDDPALQPRITPIEISVED